MSRSLRHLYLILALALSPAALSAATTPPVPLRTVAPTYPYEMQKENISGVVWVSFEVDTKGRVENASVVKSTRKAFEQAALDAVQQWIFKPGTKDGVPEVVKVQIPLQFRSNG